VVRAGPPGSPTRPRSRNATISRPVSLSKRQRCARGHSLVAAAGGFAAARVLLSGITPHERKPRPMPLILWLLGVPGIIVILLWVTGVIGF
jgi:hypothetical protein